MLKKVKFPTQSKMKKIINNLLVLATALVFVAACKGKKDDEEIKKTNAQILQEVNTVKAVGKVSPAEDWAIISSPSAARIRHIAVQEGDTVVPGQILMSLESGNADLDVDEAQARLMSFQAENKSTSADLRKAQIYAQELKDLYETSRKLFEKQAETAEKVATDYSSWQQQESVVSGLKQKITAQEVAEKEQRISIQKARNQLSDFVIKAPKAGIVTQLSAKVGQSIAIQDELGQIGQTENPIVEAEVDELFANEVQVGQNVQILALGRPDTLAQGIVFYTSPILSDKSILYETANEADDRRVRRIKIRLTDARSLTINTKVECEIKIG